MKKKSFLEADSLLQRVESREILMLRACYDQRKKPAGGGRRVPVSEYVKSAESGDRLCEAAELPRSRILVQNARSEEHTSELQSLMRISYAVFCLKKKINNNQNKKHTQETQTI